VTESSPEHLGNAGGSSSRHFTTIRMPLLSTLTTNQIKDAAGTEIEFQDIGSDQPKTRVFAKIGESPALHDRLTVKHQETGVGLKQRRRSLVRFDLAAMSDVDTSVSATDSAYLVMDLAIGARLTDANFKAVLARLLSFVASDGANTTIKLDGTGTGGQVLLTGGL